MKSRFLHNSLLLPLKLPLLTILTVGFDNIELNEADKPVSTGGRDGWSLVT